MSAEEFDEFDEDDAWYSDDPEEKEKEPFRSKINAFVPIAALVIAASFFLPTTIGGLITLGSGDKFEFGQGVTKVVTCDGEGKSSVNSTLAAAAQNVSITFTPYSKFSNASGGAGEHYFSGLKLSGIPTNQISGIDCNGVDFVVKAYSDTGTAPLAFYNGSATELVIYDNNSAYIENEYLPVSSDHNAAFVRGNDTGGIVIKSRDTEVTVTLANNVIATKNIKKFTVETRTHKPCGEGTSWTVGQTGPAGGKIFYVSDCGFPCGVEMTDFCHYLGVAPTGWNTGNDPSRTWAQSSPTNYQSADLPEFGAWTGGVGFGAFMTKQIIDQGNSTTSSSAAAMAASYVKVNSGVTYSDWFLPTQSEFRELCFNAGAIGSTWPSMGDYWTSTTVVAENGRYYVSQYARPRCAISGSPKSNAKYVRPIRAF
jgi:hypothetical protein